MWSSQGYDLSLDYSDPLLNTYRAGSTDAPAPEEMKSRRERAPRTNDVDSLL